MHRWIAIHSSLIASTSFSIHPRAHSHCMPATRPLGNAADTMVERGHVGEAIDRHLEEAGIPVSYTNVFWGGRSEIKPSEIAPGAYADWCATIGIDPQTMRA